MTKDTAHVRRNSLTFRANSLNLLIFLTGVILGCLLIYFGSTEGDLKLDWIQEPIYLSKNTELFWEVLLTDGKFLLLLYLLAFMRPGALLTPTLFGWEGILWGTTAVVSVSTWYPFALRVSARGLVGGAKFGLRLCFCRRSKNSNGRTSGDHCSFGYCLFFGVYAGPMAGKNLFSKSRGMIGK